MKNKYVAFATGRLIRLENVKDPVFSKKIMGDGFAIEVADSKIVSPCDGEITMIFPTLHAYGITSDTGIEILLHLGIDTVDLNGEGFKSYVVSGQKVKAGDLLSTMDISLIQKRQKPVTSMMIITSKNTVHLSDYDKVIKYGDEINLQID